MSGRKEVMTFLSGLRIGVLIVPPVVDEGGDRNAYVTFFRVEIHPNAKVR